MPDSGIPGGVASGDPLAHGAEKEQGALQETLEPDSPDAAWEKAPPSPPTPSSSEIKGQAAALGMKCKGGSRAASGTWG